jgi:hypothetical protein
MRNLYLLGTLPIPTQTAIVTIVSPSNRTALRGVYVAQSRDLMDEVAEAQLINNGTGKPIEKWTERATANVDDALRRRYSTPIARDQ